MFTGIIEQVGQIKEIKGNRFLVSHEYTEPFEIGESIALNGMCATVVERQKNLLGVDIIKASRYKTTFGKATTGDLVNLERAAKMGQRNSGHNVTGHIDEMGQIVTLKVVEDFWLLRVKVDKVNRKWLVHKGSVGLEGISLTVSNVSDLATENAWFEVSIIPHTWENTTLKNRSEQDWVNLEFDILGKYALNQV